MTDTMFYPLPIAVARCTKQLPKPALKRSRRRAEFARAEVMDELCRQGVRIPEFMFAHMTEFFLCDANKALRQPLPAAVAVCMGQKLTGLSFGKYYVRSDRRFTRAIRRAIGSLRFNRFLGRYHVD